MKKLFPFFIIAVSIFADTAIAQPVQDPGHVDVYVTPYYNSAGPVIDVGTFSRGLASKDESEFVATITKMKQSWDKLGFAEMYVGAIRLYDLGYRKEAIYWFYSAQYRGRLFGTLLDQEKMGGIGDPGFELLHAQDAFYELVGPYINGYAFGDIDYLSGVIQKVQKEGLVIPKIKETYAGVNFKNESEWKAANKELNDGMENLLAMLKEQKDSIKQQRAEQGIEASFSKLTNKELASH